MYGKKNNSEKSLSRFFQLIRDLKPVLFSHHPLCDKYSNHVYHVGKYKLCIGCFTYYPTILITIIISVLFIEMTLQNLMVIYVLSFIFFSAVILNIFKLTRYKFLKISSKIFIGIGAGFFITSAIFLPIHIILKIFMIFEINMYGGIIAFLRTREIEKECLKCPYKKNWDECPGMKEIRDKLYKHDFREKKKVKESIQYEKSN